MTLSDTQRLVLGRASQHPERLAAAPTGLPAAARDAVFRSMLKNGLLAECAAPREHAGLAWRRDADGIGTGAALRATDAGLRAIGVEPDGGAGAAPDEDPAPETATVADTAPAAPDAASRARSGRATCGPATSSRTAPATGAVSAC